MTDAPFPENPELLLSHADFMRALARKLIGDEHLADDVVQDALVAALQKPGEARRSMRAWLAGVVRNLSLKQVRTETRGARKARAAASPEPVRSPEEMVERETARRRVVEAVNALGEPYRSAILFRFYDDLPPREIARLLDIPVETVKTRIQRGMKRMRRQLDASYGGDGRSWCLALAPVAGLELPTASVGAATAASAITGAFVMSVKTKIFVAASLALLLGLAYTVLFLDGDGRNEQPVSIAHEGQMQEQPLAGEESASADEDRIPILPEAGANDDGMPASFAAALGGIKGRLVEEDGRPVPGTSVGIVGADFLDILRDLGESTRGGPHNLTLKEAETRTAEDGTFFLAGVHPRSFYALWADAGGPRAFARVLDLLPESGETVDLGDIALPSFVVFSGKVVDEAGEPVGGARVRATNLPPLVLAIGVQEFVRGGSFLVTGTRYFAGGVVDPPPVLHDLFDKLPISTTHTGSDGTFRLEGVPLGLALVVVDHEDFAVLPSGPHPTGRTGEKDIGSLVLTEGNSAVGTVTDHEGNPLSGIEVRAGGVGVLKKYAVLKPPVTTDKNGRFRVDGIGSDSIMVAAQRFSKNTWTVAGPLLAGDDPVTIALPAAHDLTVKVVNEGGDPVHGAQIKIRSNEFPGDFYIFDSAGSPGERLEETSPGVLVIGDLPPGKYEYLVSAPGYSAELKKATIKDESIERRVCLEPTLSVRVRVVDAADHSPVEWAQVHASIRGDDWIGKQFRLSNCRTDVDGRGLLEHLRPDRYTLAISHPGYAISFATLEVPTEDEVLLEVEAGGSVEGIVVPLSDEYAGPYMIALERSEWRHGPGGEMPRLTLTDIDGRFRVTRLTPGGWMIVVLPRVCHKSGAELLDSIDVKPYATEPIEVKSAETTYVELELGRKKPVETGSLSGRVLIDGSPPAAASLFCYVPEVVRADTEADGSYSFPELPAGEAFLLLSCIPGEDKYSSSSFRVTRSIVVESNLAAYEDFDIRSGSLSGRVVDADLATSVEGVYRLRLQTENTKAPVIVTCRFSTQPDGTFRVEQVPAGMYRMTSEDSNCPCHPIDKIQVLRGKETGPVLVEQLLYDRVAGRVVLTDEMKEAHQLRLVFNSTETESYTSHSLLVSRETGLFETNKVPPGRYNVTFVTIDNRGRYEADYRTLTFDVPEGGATGVVFTPEER